MNKIYLIIITAFLSMANFSCTPDNLFEKAKVQACCGEDGELPPPPPPPPPGD